MCNECFDNVQSFKNLESQCQEIQSSLTSQYLKNHPDSQNYSDVLIKEEIEIDFHNFDDGVYEEEFVITQTPIDESLISSKTFECDQCGKEFANKDDVLDHLESHDDFGDGFRCNDCNKNYPTSIGLEVHLASDHDKAKGPLSCPKCPKTAENRELLRRHLRIHKENQDKIICSM